MLYIFPPVSGQYIFSRALCLRKGCVMSSYDFPKLFLKNYS